MGLHERNLTTINPQCESNHTVNSYGADHALNGVTMITDNFTTINSECELSYFPYCNAAAYAMDCTVTVMACFSGVPLNIYVVWLILRGAESRIRQEFFTVNLALNDILYFTGFLLMPFVIFIGQTILRILNFLHGFLITGRALFQTCICVERYLAVIHPVLFLKYKPLRYRLVCSVIIWLVTMISCVGLLFTIKNDFMAVFWFTLYVPFFGVMLFCCLALLRGLCKPGPGEGERQGGRDNQAKMKAFKIILVIVFLQLITIIAMIVQYYALFNFDPTRFEITISVAFLLIMSTCLIQPLLYLHRAGKLPSLICRILQRHYIVNH